MKVALIANTRSGRGRGLRAAETIAAGLREDGHTVQATAVGDPPEALGSAMDGAAALLIAGGDGSIHRAAPEAMRLMIPIYHIPCGNENLFAREFGMDRSLATIRRALDHQRMVRVDVGQIDTGGVSLPFLLMCSLGPDASVIHRLTKVRTRAIGHLAYSTPIWQELLRPHLPLLRVRIDGKLVVDGRRGILVIANSRQYALRIDPAARASMTDGLLDAVFLPAEGRIATALWGVRCRLRHLGRAAVQEQGREIEVESLEGPAVFQSDGDAPDSPVESPVSRLRLSLKPAALPVLIP